MHVAILNHALTQQALALKQAFQAHVPTLAFDSGSQLTPGERAGFTMALPNVYYCGLLNAVTDHLAELNDEEPIYFWASDVDVSDESAAVRRAEDAFADPKIGTYAPSAWFSGHPQMWNKGTGRCRTVLFVEGFCFATRAGLLRRLCPINTAVNAYGWGVDLQLGYLTRRAGRYTVVDDGIEVRHPRSTGYSTVEASRHRAAWVETLDPGARRFHRVACWKGAARRPWVGWLASLKW